MRLDQIPDAPLNAEEIEAVSNKTFDYADKERVSLREAKRQYRIEMEDKLHRSTLASLNRVIGTNYDTTDPSFRQGEITQGYGDFTFREKVGEVGKAVHRGLGSIVKLPGVALKVAGELPLNRQERSRASGSPFAVASRAGNMITERLRVAGNKYIDVVNNMTMPESNESRSYRELPFSSAPIYRTSLAVGESAPTYGLAIAATLTTQNPNIGLYILGSTTASSAYENLREQGVDPDLALLGAVAEGSIEILTEKIPMDMLMKGGGRPFLIRALKLGTAESFQELFAQLGQNYVDAVVKDIDPENYSTSLQAAKQEWGIISQGWQDAMAAGFVMGGGAAAFSPTPDFGRSAEEMRNQYGVSPRNTNEFVYLLDQIKQKVNDVEKATETPAEAEVPLLGETVGQAVEPTPQPTPQAKVTPEGVPLLGTFSLEEAKGEPITQPATQDLGSMADEQLDELEKKISDLTPEQRLSIKSQRQAAIDRRDAKQTTFEEIGEGELKPRGSSASVLAQAIEAELINENEDIEGQIPTYKSMSMKDQAQKTAVVIEQQGVEQSKRYAFYKEQSPEGLYPENIYTGLRVHAELQADSDLLQDLAFKKEALIQHTIAGKRVKSLDTGQNFANPIGDFQAVSEARKGKLSRDGGDTIELEAKLAEVETKLAEADKKLAKKTQKTKREYGAKNKLVSRDAYNEIIVRQAQQASQMKGGRNLGAVYVPTAQDFADLAKLSLFHLEAIGQDIATWSNKMAQDLGEWARPHLAGAYNEAVLVLETEKQKESLEKSIAEYERKIKEKDLSTKTKKAIETPELKQLRAKRDALRKELQGLRDAQKPKKSPEQVKLQSQKSRLKTETKKLEKSIANLDFEKHVSEPVKLDEEGMTLKVIRDSLKSQYKAAQAAANLMTEEEMQIIADLAQASLEYKAKMEASPRRDNSKNKPATKPEMEWGIAQFQYKKYVDGLKHEANKKTLKKTALFYLDNKTKLISDTFGVLKSAVTTWDNSFIGRQGLKLFYKGLTGDIKSAKVWWGTFFHSFNTIYKSIKKDNVNMALFAEIVSDPDYDLLKESRVAINVTEEEIPVDFLGRIPFAGIPFRASEHAFSESARYMRYKTAKMYFNIWRKSGRELNERELRSIGLLTNSLTGRGDTGTNQQPGLVNNVFFSPRNLRASLDLLTLHLFDNQFSGFARIKAAENLLRFISGAAGILFLAKFIDDDSVTWDTNSADFGKIKVGNTRFSVGGGNEVLIVLASRLGTRIFTSSTTGKTKSIDTGGYGQISGESLLWNFLKNKASPGASFVLELINQRTREGEGLSVKNAVYTKLTPLIVQTAFESGNVEDSADMLAIILAEMFGVGVQTYDGHGYKKKSKSDIWDN